jgi:hypothetical protein
VLVRSGQTPIVVNLDIPAAAQGEHAQWIDDVHRRP